MRLVVDWAHVTSRMTIQVIQCDVRHTRSLSHSSQIPVPSVVAKCVSVRENDEMAGQLISTGNRPSSPVVIRPSWPS